VGVENGGEEQQQHAHVNKEGEGVVEMVVEGK